jgi:hypothetical protein
MQPCDADTVAERESRTRRRAVGLIAVCARAEGALSGAADVHVIRTRPDRVDDPDDLMTRHDRRLRERKIPFDNVQVRAADAACTHTDSKLARPRFTGGDLCHNEWRLLNGRLDVEHHCMQRIGSPHR